MTLQATVDNFLSHHTLALAGASHTGRKFGNSILRGLVANGYQVYPVHPSAEMIDGIRCHRSLRELPTGIGGLVVVVPPDQTRHLVREAAELGIQRVWLQQGSSKDDIVQFCAEQGIEVVHGECILMFLPHGSAIHRYHRWFRGFFGRLPR